MVETTLSSPADGPFVESSLSAIEAHEDAEKAPIAARLGSTRIEHPERNGTEVRFPASVVHCFEPYVLLVDAAADVELHSVNADNSVALGALDSEVRRIFEFGQLIRKWSCGWLVA